MKIMNKDKEAFGAMCDTGHVRREHLESLDITENRINTYLEEELVKREVNDGEESFSLTKKGHDLAEEEMNIHNHYRQQGATHDLGLADKYFDLDYRERDTYLNETELKEMLREHIEEIREVDQERAEKLEEDYREGRLSVPDCAYTKENGETEVYEVVTANYSKEQIAAKEEFSREMGMNYSQGRR